MMVTAEMNSDCHTAHKEGQMSVVTVDNLHKRYGDVHAVDGISFEIQRGEIFGLLGPNGAGKTTTINVLCTYTEPTAGEVVVVGHSVIAEPEAVKRVIGVVPQDIALYPDLNAVENLRFFGRMHDVPRARLEQHIADLLQLVGLAEHARRRVEHYSGGMKRRLNLAVGLLSEPRFLMLDEPTVGVDPQSRNAIFENIQALNRQGLTILYTTHYMEEAELLCHRVAIMDEGRIIALDTPQNLINTLGTGLIHIGVKGELDDQASAYLQAVQTSVVRGVRPWLRRWNRPGVTILTCAARSTERPRQPWGSPGAVSCRTHLRGAFNWWMPPLVGKTRIIPRH
jgi:ABC-2 type transport system ATP-binding protein